MKNRVEQRNISNALLRQEAIKALNNKGNASGLAGCVNSNGSSSKTTQDGVLYFVGEVTDGGKINLFEAIVQETSASRVGLTNFDGNKLAAGSNAVLDAISIEVATTNDTDGHPDMKGLDYSESADPAIKAAEFRFTVDGKEKINIPVYEIHNANSTRTNDEKYRELGHLPIIEALQQVEAWFNFPSGVAPSGADGKRHYVKVSLRRNQTVSR